MSGQTEFTKAVEDEAHWLAVIENDEDADGDFVYAVSTTGVYCRPSCRSRQPNREVVVFYDSPEEAERDGYRACLKCGGKPSAPDDADIEAVAMVCDIIESGIFDSDRPGLKAIAKRVGMQPHRLQRVFRRLMGVTLKQYVEARSMIQLRSDLRAGETISDAIYGAGLGSTSRLYEKSDAELGMTPASYRFGGFGATIVHALRPGPVNLLVLVAATVKGVCFVALGDDEPSLVGGLLDEFRAANHLRDDHGLGRMLDDVLDHLNGRTPDFRLPLDIRKTAFQRLVWQALSDIPYGETRSYSEIAAAIGHPDASRPVAQACARNPVALLIPCHRAVSKNGRMTGYRWGVDNKRRLIAMERVQARSGPTGNG